MVLFGVCDTKKPKLKKSQKKYYVKSIACYDAVDRRGKATLPNLIEWLLDYTKLKHRKTETFATNAISVITIIILT